MATDVHRLILDQIIPMGASIAALEHRLERMEDRLHAIEHELAESQQTNRHDALAARLDAVEDQLELMLSRTIRR